MVVLAFAENIQLLPDGTLLVHIAMILAMIWILNRTFFRPINKVIASREKNKGGRSSEAAGLMSQVGEKQARYSGEVLEARTQGYELIEKEKAGAMKDLESRVATARDEAAEKFAGEKETLEKEVAAARKTLGSEAETVAEQISSRILKG